MKKVNVMVCVTQQKTCERLILSGYNLTKSKKGKLYVVHVVNEKEKFLESINDGEALEYLFGVSKKVGADLTVLRSKDVIKTIIDFAQNNNITHMVMGTAPDKKGTGNSDFGLILQNNLSNIEFTFL